MGRRPSVVAPVILGVIMRLHPGVDDDLITFFKQIPALKRAQAVKAALRAGGMAAYAVVEQADDGEMAELVSGLLY